MTGVPLYATRGGVVAAVECLSEFGIPDQRVEVVEQLNIRAERGSFLDKRTIPLAARIVSVAIGGDHRVLAVAAGRAHESIFVAGDTEGGWRFVHTRVSGQ